MSDGSSAPTTSAKPCRTMWERERGLGPVISGSAAGTNRQRSLAVEQEERARGARRSAGNPSSRSRLAGEPYTVNADRPSARKTSERQARSGGAGIQGSIAGGRFGDRVRAAEVAQAQLARHESASPARSRQLRQPARDLWRTRPQRLLCQARRTVRVGFVRCGSEADGRSVDERRRAACRRR